MKIKIFGKPSCAKCETTKNKFSHFLEKKNLKESVSLEFYDMDTLDGLTEGSYNDVLKIPTTIIEKDQGVLARWNGEVPITEEFKVYFEGVEAKV